MFRMWYWIIAYFLFQFSTWDCIQFSYHCSHRKLLSLIIIADLKSVLSAVLDIIPLLKQRPRRKYLFRSLFQSVIPVTQFFCLGSMSYLGGTAVEWVAYLLIANREQKGLDRLCQAYALNSLTSFQLAHLSKAIPLCNLGNLETKPSTHRQAFADICDLNLLFECVIPYPS